MPASLTHVAVGHCAVAPCLLPIGYFPFAPPRRALHLTMTSQYSRRERASSDRAQAQPVPSIPPQRPGLQSRTISAPVGGLYKLNTSNISGMDNGHKVDRAVIEEDEFLSSPGRNRVSSPRAGDEV